jgi:hypothetical protein
VNSLRTGSAALAAAFTLGACGSTYYDSSVTVPITGATTTTTLAPIADDTPLPVLLSTMSDLMQHLDEQIVDGADNAAALARIEEVWRIADRAIRADNPDDVTAFLQVMELARTGVQKRRPADASKGYRLLVTAIDSLDLDTAGG